MADATSLTPPSPGLSATLFQNKSVEPKRTENIKITTQYQYTANFLGPPHGTTTGVACSLATLKLVQRTEKYQHVLKTETRS